MQIDPLVPFSQTRGTVPSVVPFTIRENPSLLMLVEEMRKWISVELVPFINENIKELSDNWVKEINLLIASWEKETALIKESFDSEVQRLNDLWVEKTLELTEYVQSIGAGLEEGIELAKESALAAKAAKEAAEMFASQVEAIQDDAVSTLVVNEVSKTHKSVSNLILDNGLVSVKLFGAKGDGETDDTAAFIAAMDEADRNPGSSIFLPPGNYNVNTGLNMENRRCGIVGSGSGFTGGKPTGSVIYAKNQSGPVLDMTKWKFGDNFRGRATFTGFTVSGNSTAIVENMGIKIGDNIGGLSVSNIVVLGVGGTCLEMGAVYLSDFERITLLNPVMAKTNNVPHLRMTIGNGNRFNGIGVMGPNVGRAESCAKDGAIQLLDLGKDHVSNNRFTGTWFENIECNGGGTFFRIRGGTDNIIDGTQFFDCFSEEGSVGDSWFRLEKESGTAAPYGGNTISGNIPGSYGSTILPDFGVDVYQSNNRIIGTKGYRENNVRLNIGVDRTTVSLGGSRSSSTGPMVIDNSGRPNNRLNDGYTGIDYLGNKLITDSLFSGGTALKRFYASSDEKTGGIALGKTDAKIMSLGGNGAIFIEPGPSGIIVFRTNGTETAFSSTPQGLEIGSGTTAPRIISGTGDPSGARSGRKGTIYLRTDGDDGAAYVKTNNAPSSGWVKIA